MSQTTLAPWITRMQVSGLRTITPHRDETVGRPARNTWHTRENRPAPAVRSPYDNRTPATAGFAPAVVAAPATPARTTTRRPTFAEVDAAIADIPVGVYALPRRADAGEGQSVYFFKVEQMRKGGKRIAQVTGGVGQLTVIPMKTTWQLRAAQGIAKDIAAAAKLFGDTLHYCGICAGNGRWSPLTRDRSRAAGYGKTCAEKNGLPY